MERAGKAAEGRERLHGHLALVLVQVLFGIFPVFGRVALDQERGFEPFALATWRVVFGALFFGLLAFATSGRRALPPRELWGRILGLAFLGIVANQGLFLLGLARSSATEAGILICLIPVFTFALALLTRQERLDPVRILGLVIALLGMVPLVFARSEGLQVDHTLGNLLMALNCLCYAAYLVGSRPLVQRFPPLVVGAWVYLASLPFLPIFLWGTSLAPRQPEASAVWWSLLFVLLGATALTYLLNLFALRRVRASTTAFYIYLQPMLAAGGAALFLSEPVGKGLLPAALGIILGGLLVLHRR